MTKRHIVSITCNTVHTLHNLQAILISMYSLLYKVHEHLSEMQNYT